MESVAERFLRYVSFDTQSDEASESCPSTPKQKLLGQALVEEMKAMGIADQIGSILTSKAVEEVTKDENQIELTSCENCANDCKDEVEPGGLAICEKYRRKA